MTKKNKSTIIGICITAIISTFSAGISTKNSQQSFLKTFTSMKKILYAKHERATRFLNNIACINNRNSTKAKKNLMMIKNTSSIPQLLYKLKHSRSRITAFNILQILKAYLPNHRLVTRIKKWLRSSNTKCRLYAVRLLGRLSYPALDKKIFQLFDDPDISVVREVYSVLSARKYPYLKKAFLNGCRNLDAEIRMYSAKGLGRQKDARTVPILLRLLKDEESVSDAAMKSILLIGNSAGKAVMMMLKQESDRNIQMQYIEILGKIKYHNALSVLVRFLNTDDEFLKRKAVKTLGLIKDKRAVPHLIKALKDTRVISTILNAFSKIKDRRTVPVLLRYLKNGSPELRLQALFALASIGDKRAVIPIVKLLKDKDHHVRIWTADILAGLKDRRAIPYLRSALPDATCLFREFILHALTKLNRIKKKPVIDHNHATTDF